MNGFGKKREKGTIQRHRPRGKSSTPNGRRRRQHHSRGKATPHQRRMGQQHRPNGGVGGGKHHHQKEEEGPPLDFSLYLYIYIVYTSLFYFCIFVLLYFVSIDKTFFMLYFCTFHVLSPLHFSLSSVFFQNMLFKVFVTCSLWWTRHTYAARKKEDMMIKTKKRPAHIPIRKKLHDPGILLQSRGPEARQPGRVDARCKQSMVEIREDLRKQRCTVVIKKQKSGGSSLQRILF